MLPDYDGKSPKMKLECTRGTFNEILEFGFLYKNNIKTRKPSNGESECYAVENPTKDRLIIEESVTCVGEHCFTQKTIEIDTLSEVRRLDVKLDENYNDY